MTMHAAGTSTAIRVWRSSVAGRAWAAATRGRPPALAWLGACIQRPLAPAADEPLTRLADSSRAVRALARTGALAIGAWNHSAAAAAMRGWRARRLDDRLRLVAIVSGAAVVTHLVLTGFSAPAPAFAARITWIVIVAALAAAGLGARHLAAAWTDRAARRHPSEGWL